jgi:PAS domain S-box-containing protein
MKTIKYPDEVDAAFDHSPWQKPPHHEISVTAMSDETTNCVVILVNPAGLVISWSNAARDILGYDEDEAIGKSMAHFYETNANDRDDLSITLKIASINPGFYTENWLIKKGGTRFWAWVRYNALFDCNGRLVGYSTTIRDLTEIKRTRYKSPRQTIRADKKQPAQINRHSITDASFRKLIENSYSGIILIDKSLNITFRSRAAERITGWNLQNWGNNTMMENIHLADREKVWAVFSALAKMPGNSRECVFRSEHADGHYVSLECVFTNFFTDPDIGAMLCNFRDISGKQHADELIHQSLKELSDYKCALDESAIVSITDHKGMIKYVNDAFCTISKYSREELIGHDHRIINSSFHDKAYIRNLWTTIAKGKIWRGEFRNKAKDGSFYWVYATIVPFLNKKGKPYQYVSVRFDITIRKKIMIALEESEQKYSELFHLSPLPMYVFEMGTLNFLDVNDAFIKYYGYGREEILSMSLKDLRLPEEVPELESRLLDDNMHHMGVFNHLLKNGDTIKVDIQSNLITYKGKKARLAISNDVTERLKYVSAIEDQNKKLKEISWIQSHLVRAPLARIIGLTALIKDHDCIEEERHDMLEYLRVSCDELDKVISKITNKARE